MKPLIGVTGREFKYGLVEGAPAVLADASVEVVLADYIDAVLASGGLPVHVPLRLNPEEIIERLDGLIIAGGADIEPKHYGAEPEADLGDVEPERDAFELALARFAIDASLPTVGICRGIQVLAVAGNGTLHQHRPDHQRFDLPPKTLSHGITIEADTILSDLYGDTLQVNSLHHQVVGTVGEGTRVAATAEDGEIESIEFTNKPIVGVQWHPEMYQTREPIFDWLVETAGAS